MKAKISIYSTGTRTIKADSGEKIKTSYERTLIAHTIEVKGSEPVSKKLAKISHFATGVIGARAAAMLAADKRMPSKVFFRMEIGGKVYSSETVLVRSNLLNTIAVSLKSLVGKSRDEVIEAVRLQQKRGIQTAVQYLQDVARLAKEAEKFDVSGTADLSDLRVDGAGLVEDEPATEGVTGEPVVGQ